MARAVACKLLKPFLALAHGRDIQKVKVTVADRKKYKCLLDKSLTCSCSDKVPSHWDTYVKQRTTHGRTNLQPFPLGP